MLTLLVIFRQPFQNLDLDVISYHHHYMFEQPVKYPKICGHTRKDTITNDTPSKDRPPPECIELRLELGTLRVES